MPEDIDLKKTLVELGSAFEEFKKTNDAAIAEVKKGFADVVTSDKLQRIQEGLDKLSDAKVTAEKAVTSRIDEIEKRMNRSDLGMVGKTESLDAEAKEFNIHRKSARSDAILINNGEVDAETYASYKSKFGQVVRYGDKGIVSEIDRKSLSVGIDTDGGFVVPADTSGRIVTRVFETSNIRPYCTVQQVSTGALEGLRDTDEVGAVTWAGENDTDSLATTPTLGGWRIDVNEARVTVRATQRILDDASINIEAWLSAKVAEKISRAENAVFVTGTGIRQPRGFTTYTTAATADSSRSWGTFEHVVTGVNGNLPTSNPADKFFDLEAAFKPAYLANANIFTRRSVVQLIRKIKTGDGQYLWQPGLVAGKPNSIIGYPIVLCEDMPALSSNGLSLAMGDMRTAYTIVDRIGMRVVRNPYASPLSYVNFHTSYRVGGGAVQFEALKFLKFST